MRESHPQALILLTSDLTVQQSPVLEAQFKPRITPPSLPLLYQKTDLPLPHTPENTSPLGFSAHCLDWEILKVSLTGDESEREEREPAMVRPSGNMGGSLFYL